MLHRGSGTAIDRDQRGPPDPLDLRRGRRWTWWPGTWGVRGRSLGPSRTPYASLPIKGGAVERWQRLARDVGVNVLANVIAAPIIYLGGVAVGLFSANRAALAVSIFVLILAIEVAVGAWVYYRMSVTPTTSRRWRIETAIFTVYCGAFALWLSMWRIGFDVHAAALWVFGAVGVLLAVHRYRVVVYGSSQPATPASPVTKRQRQRERERRGRERRGRRERRKRGTGPPNEP